MTAKKKKAQVNPASTDDAAMSRLPFEPVPTRQKQPKQSASSAVGQPETAQNTIVQAKARSRNEPTSSSIPEVVNRRMVSRAAIFCGIPTVLAVLTFVVCYFAVINNWFKPPNAAVILVSLGFFGIGVLGLSYGPLSASWDEERLGSWLGWGEFKLNFGRLRDSWRAAKAAQKETDTPPSV